MECKKNSHKCRKMKMNFLFSPNILLEKLGGWLRQQSVNIMFTANSQCCNNVDPKPSPISYFNQDHHTDFVLTQTSTEEVTQITKDFFCHKVWRTILHENPSLKTFDGQLWVLCLAFIMIL